jgi:hypothetical protein
MDPQHIGNASVEINISPGEVRFRIRTKNVFLCFNTHEMSISNETTDDSLVFNGYNKKIHVFKSKVIIMDNNIGRINAVIEKMEIYFGDNIDLVDIITKKESVSNYSVFIPDPTLIFSVCENTKCFNFRMDGGPICSLEINNVPLNSKLFFHESSNGTLINIHRYIILPCNLRITVKVEKELVESLPQSPGKTVCLNLGGSSVKSAH